VHSLLLEEASFALLLPARFLPFAMLCSELGNRSESAIVKIGVRLLSLSEVVKLSEWWK